MVPVLRFVMVPVTSSVRLAAYAGFVVVIIRRATVRAKTAIATVMQLPFISRPSGPPGA